MTGTASLASLLFDHPFADGAPLLHTREASLSAGAARAHARGIATRLADRGVGPGDAVVVRVRGGLRAAVTMFGVWSVGGVLVPVHDRTPAPELTRVLDATAPRAVVTDRIEVRTGAHSYDPGVAFVTWTSGTTGAPTPVLHEHVGYLALLDRVLRALRGAHRGAASPPPANLVPLSLALNAGLYNLCFGLRAGAAVVLMDGFDTRVFAELVRRFSITSTVLPPAAMTMLTDDERVTDLAPLRYVRSITAPLSPLQARRFTEKFGAGVLNGYGQAEIGEVIGWTAADLRTFPDKLGAAGRPHAGVTVTIADADGEPLPTGEVGRLLVRAPAMATGDASGASLAHRLDATGALDTGDFARVDADGFVWIEGRASDVINRGGNKVFPDQVEEVLRLGPEVVDAAVVGVRDRRLGEVPVAFVVGAIGTTDDELRALCREHLAPYKVPVAFHRIDALPRSEVGKVLRRELAARHDAATTEPV